MSEKSANVYVTENKVKNVLMISFKSPLKLDKKGGMKQINKSMGAKYRGKEEEVREIAQDIKSIIDDPRYYTSYDGYLEAKEKFHPKAVEVFFNTSEFENIYNDKFYGKILEEKIPIKQDVEDEQKSFKITRNNWHYTLPTFLLIGLPGSGKTTLQKQIIGATKTSFPATSQSNTTIGRLEILSKQSFPQGSPAQLKLVSSFYSEALINEKIAENIKRGLLYVVSNVVVEDNILHEIIMETKDRKFKFNCLIGEDISLVSKVIDSIQSLGSRLWDLFCQENKEVKGSFNDNNEQEIQVRFQEFIEDNIEFNDIVESFMEVVLNKYREIVGILVTYIHGILQGTVYTCNIVTRKGKIEANEKSVVEEVKAIIAKSHFPQYIEISLGYKSNDRPDAKLRHYFFKTCEFISSADEEMRGSTLFPLIRATRIAGNFRPLWMGEEEYKDFIIVDSEGYGHDISNREIPRQLREVLLKCDRIRWVQDGSKPISVDNKELLKYLIVSGYIGKTDFCINRLENFDKNSNNSIESKVKYIRQGLESLIDALADDEINSQDKIVTGKENTFKRLISDRTYLFEYLNKVIENRDYLATEKYAKVVKTIETLKLLNVGEEEIETLESLLEEEKIYLNGPIKTTENIEQLVSNLDVKKEPDWYAFKPIYKYDKFVHNSASISNKFKDTFLGNLRDSTWQAIKAFNNRVWYDTDGREWRLLKPEATLDRLIKISIYSFLTNPQNLEEIEDIDRFIECIDFVVGVAAESIEDIVKDIIVDTNSSEWEEGAVNTSGAGSTATRYSLITKIINSNFDINYEEGRYDKLYDRLKQVILENPYLVKELKAKTK